MRIKPLLHGNMEAQTAKKNIERKIVFEILTNF